MSYLGLGRAYVEMGLWSPGLFDELLRLKACLEGAFSLEVPPL